MYVYTLLTQPEETAHADVGPAPPLSLGEMAVLQVCHLKLVLLHALAVLKPTGRSTCWMVVGRCLCPEVSLDRVHCMSHTNVCGATAVGARVRTAVVGLGWFRLHRSSPAGSQPGWRSLSGTLTQDTSQCGHPSAVYLQQSALMPHSSRRCKGDGLHVDPQWSCDVTSKTDLTAPIRLWLHSEGPGFSSPIWPPYMPFF